MRIYTNENTWSNVYDAARKAGVTFTRAESFTPRVSQEKGGFDSGFDLILTGDSRRNQNQGDDKAATWDQWGVFLSVLFNVDNDMKAGSPTQPYYDGSADFDYKTDGRFSNPGVFPDDTHGDHTFRYSGPGSHTCTKCSALHRWM